MYTLYFSPNACSLATQIVLRELQLPFQLRHKDREPDFSHINPTGAAPTLHDGSIYRTEGAAIMLSLLQNHSNSLWPSKNQAQKTAIQDIMFANATMHPTYGHLFFINSIQNLDKNALHQLQQAATERINRLWQIVEDRLKSQNFLGGYSLSAADIMLAVYARWGEYFDTDIKLGHRTQKMLNAVYERDSFVQSLQAEQEQTAN